MGIGDADELAKARQRERQSDQWKEKHVKLKMLDLAFEDLTSASLSRPPFLSFSPAILTIYSFSPFNTLLKRSVPAHMGGSVS